MASSAPKIPEVERHDAPDIVAKKAKALAVQIQECKRFVVFTGAGISTSAGIPDFRGPEGVWTLRAQGRDRPGKAVNTLKAIPTPTHMALLELQNRAILTYLVSQNCDGLHRRSGILPENISELHGNNNREYCKECGKEYIRDFRAVAAYEKTVHDHRTGRKCALCDGPLLDSIINFGEPLPEVPLQRAFDHAAKADLCLVLGSSLTVTPANEIPEVVGQRRGAKLVICNLQKTPLDGLSDLRIHCNTDDLMTQIMKNLELPIPQFILRRRLSIQLKSPSDSRHELTVGGVDVDGTPVTFLQSVKLENNRRTIRSEPFSIQFRGDLVPGLEFKVELEFMGHYEEPNLKLVHQYSHEQDMEGLYHLEYNPYRREWKVTRETTPGAASL
ncbi:DHS-like NAD/FAD-binding domain-containing protein [Dactylonectria estremocensis]|uniref:protein acetyllysine N-acetyltransferase n=1 Tax=Dactylonectria estremocensis TaxID=1079267 RepID=A0A9P9E2K9_9HYPO|nr:DHS-like NAD/FAD-binding domain-containing protein [Dactylonectria estremocensis]